MTIASSPDFTLLGDSPGISDDGTVVVFFGDPAIMIDGSDEPGVFASVDEGAGTRKLIRLTGRTAELGRDAAGNPIGFDPTSIAFFNRVTVINQDLGGPGPDGDSFTACFQATPTGASPDGLFTAENGLWTLRTDIKLVSGVLEYRKLGPVLVVQIGSVVGGRTIADIAVNDAISSVTTDTIGSIPRAVHPGENRVTFFATTNSDDIIVRASYLDPDEDNLPRTYIATLSMTDSNGNTNLVQLDHVITIPCSFSLSLESQSFTSSGGAGSTNVTAVTGCNWTVTSNKSWIVLVSDGTGSGSGPVDFEIRENFLLGSRQGTMTVAGQTLTITQLGNCSFSITPQSKSFVSAGGTGSVNVTVSDNCDWAAISNASWITITSGSVGIGSGSVSYSVAPNTGPTRTGTMIIAGRTFTVTQKPGS